jgi:molybdopterin synthase sulfur carrier subunit
MKIRLRLFASLREQTGTDDEMLLLPEDVRTLAGLREHLRAQGGSWSEALDPKKAIRGAVNQRMANDHDPISEGDEVAFFPPVTGG